MYEYKQKYIHINYKNFKKNQHSQNITMNDFEYKVIYTYWDIAIMYFRFLSAPFIKYIYLHDKCIDFITSIFVLSIITCRDCKNGSIFDKIKFIIFDVTRKRTTIDSTFYNQVKQNKSYRKEESFKKIQY